MSKYRIIDNLCENYFFNFVGKMRKRKQVLTPINEFSKNSSIEVCFSVNLAANRMRN